jgi:hypothetical protein
LVLAEELANRSLSLAGLLGLGLLVLVLRLGGFTFLRLSCRLPAWGFAGFLFGHRK